jgi:hypothetical protein
MRDAARRVRYLWIVLRLGCVLVDGELAVLVGQVSPYVTAAVGAYGSTVLAKVNDEAANATLGLGQRMLRRIFGTRGAGDAPQPVADLAADPDDPDLQAALRVAIRKVLAVDTELANDLRAMLAAEAAVTITASGKRSVAAHSIAGVVATGDDVIITR